MAVSALSGQQIQASVADLADWEIVGSALHRELRFADFSEAWAFLSRVALLAERMNHHPEWNNVYNRVSLKLTTHEADGLSELDFTMARAIDRFLAEDEV